MKKIRTFIAHPVPEEWKEIIGEAYGSLREGLESKIAWVKPENMHFTLKFLGPIEESKLAEVQEVLKNIPVVNFKISTAGAGFFPALEKPHVIWIGLEQGAKEFCSTAATIESEMAKLDFKENRKSCHAHLTLGRVKKIAEDDWTVLAEKINSIKLPETEVNGFTLYKSVLTPDGPIYSVIKEYR
ncbi:RNA 2',3'-cyclic phosphodiesterase [Maridesulfovibrio salexigens]|uniref:RNA 2',3'-cyclic phosphodiesterase n=1 Tax=Maridesulfovibrio salexigens (strain ATCC 14822 / DSM 2638 / NCIMB 8403 / VKM B-1763) TaxID=526222 RepID=C6BS46_MARSD|nr:RNA 2',3'-cyclic phosphodiesterase [Maridesulfovibrio salexigens]ACS81429.1 2'-5' RNA ligase [Maridesulfovibrio salexigens DSM 2638]